MIANVKISLIKHIGIFTFVFFFLSACTHLRTTEQIGPDACPSNSFLVIDPLVLKDNNGGYSLDLLSSYAVVTAGFNEIISYTFSVTGQTSGAVFKVEGKSNAIHFNWYGNSSNGKYFSKGEELSYTLINLCKPEPLGSKTITLTTAVGYAGFGLKILNFEDSPAIPVSVYGDCSPLPAPGKSYAYGSSQLMTPSSPVDYQPSPQGTNYYKFKADSVSSPAYRRANGQKEAWYFGNTTFTGISYTGLGDDPNKIYLNFFAKGQANSQAQFILTEKAYGTSLTRKYLANVGSEWKLYSVRLSDLGVIKPSAITGLSFDLGAALYRDVSAEVDLDMIIFTVDKPF